MSSNKNVGTIGHFLNVGIGTIINIILGLITTPLITRIADPSEYGQLSVFNAYADILLAFLYLGLDKSLVRFFYDKEDIKSKRSLLKVCFLIPIITTIISMIALYGLTKLHILPEKFSDVYLFLLAMYCLVSVWNKISTILLRSAYLTKEYSFCTILQKAVYCLVIIFYVFCVKKNYFMMLVMSSMISTAIAGAYATIVTKEYWLFIDSPKPTNFKQVMSYGLPFIMYSCAGAILDSMDKLALDHYCTDSEVGIYSSAILLVSVFLIFKTIFETMWIPMQTEHFVNNPDDPTFIKKGSLYLTIILFFIGINVIMFKDIICFILGSKYRDASQIIPFLYIGSSIYAISDTTMCGIDISRKSYLHAIAGFIACIVNLVGNNTLVPLIGPKGAAMATCLSFVVYFVIRTYFSNLNYYVDYSLRRMFVIWSLLSVFAFINTFYMNIFLNIIIYVVIMFIFVLLYNKDLRDMFSYIKGLLPRRNID